MNFTFNCQCGQPLATDTAYAGMQVQCPQCGNILIVPGQAPTPTPANPAPPQPIPPQSNFPQAPPPQQNLPPNPQLNPLQQPNPPIQPTPNPYPEPKPIPTQQAGMIDNSLGMGLSPAVQPAARPPGMGRKPLNSFGMIAGIASIAFAVLHLGCGVIFGIASVFLRDVQSSVPFGAGNWYFSYAQAGLAMFILLNLAYAGSLIAGSVGLFRSQTWGWITGNINAALAMIVVIIVVVGYFKTVSSIDTVESTVNQATESTEFSQRTARATKTLADDQREQVGWSALILIALYGGYCALVAIMLLTPATMRDYGLR